MRVVARGLAAVRVEAVGLVVVAVEAGVGVVGVMAVMWAVARGAAEDEMVWWAAAK